MSLPQIILLYTIYQALYSNQDIDLSVLIIVEYVEDGKDFV